MDDIFEGSARAKFYEILAHASPAVVQNELDAFFTRYVAMNEFCEQSGFDECALQGFIASHSDAIEAGLNDIYIGLSGEILSQNE